MWSVFLCLCASDNLSPRAPPDEIGDPVQQQPVRHDGDDDDDRETGSVDSPQSESSPDVNPDRAGHRGDPASAESRHDVAVQVDDLTRQSSSTQTGDQRHFGVVERPEKPRVTASQILRRKNCVQFAVWRCFKTANC